MADKPVAKPPGSPTPAKPAKPSGTPSATSSGTSGVSGPAKPPGVATPAEPPKPVHIGGESIIDRIRPHIKILAIITGGAVVLLLVLATVAEIRESRQESDTEKVDHVLAVAQRPVRGKDEKPDPKRPSFADPKERATAVLDALAKQDTDATGHAFRAGLLLDAGKIDEAIAAYRAGTSGKSIGAVQCREGLGLALEAKAAAEKDSAARQKGLEEALAAFVAMQPDEAGPRRAYALYHQGRLQLLLGKRAEAKSLLEKAKEVNNNTDNEIDDLIEKRLAALGDS
jgi:tetratricopeptide (TPR) repeat protein